MEPYEVEIFNAQASEIDAALLPPRPEAEAEEAAGGTVSTITEAGELIKFAVALFVPLYPSIEAIYAAPQQARLAEVAAPLMEKYGVTMGGIFERWGAEINFLIVAGPMAAETARAIRRDNAERKAKKQAEEAKANEQQQSE